jgi:hypothetical protein
MEKVGGRKDGKGVRPQKVLGLYELLQKREREKTEESLHMAVIKEGEKRKTSAKKAM